MPSRNLPLVEDAYYHIFNRGVNRQEIFFNKRNYRHFLKALDYYRYLKPPISFSRINTLSTKDWENFSMSKFAHQKNVSIVCYCLMPNHFHLILQQTSEEGISTFMRRATNSYTKYLNKRENRTGPLFEGVFKSRLIETDQHLLHLSRYIHLNPYTSFLIKNHEDLLNYPWSSLKDYLSSNENLMPKIEKEIVTDQFENYEEYKKFVLDQSDYQREISLISHLAIDSP